MIKTIFFDIGGVLLNIHPEKTIKYLSKISNLNEEDVVGLFPKEAHHKYERGEIADTEFYEAVKQNFPESHNLTEDQFWKAWSMLVGKETEVLQKMNKLSEVYPIWLLSNTNPFHILKEKRLKMFDKITGGIYSFEIGSRKPEPEIYHQALKITDTKAEEALFIDDLSENVLQARLLGINAIHFTSVNDLDEQLENIL